MHDTSCTVHETRTIPVQFFMMCSTDLKNS